jgi:septal ring factor EnvC (AmiA/AmiB activator)
MWINGRFVPMFMLDADKGGAGGGSDSDPDGGDDSNLEDDEGRDEDLIDDEEGGVDELQAKLDNLKKENKKELDRYRNKVGKLEKKLKEMEQETMSEEEKLEAKQKELQEKESKLRKKELRAHKAEKVAESELNKELAEFIDIDQMHQVKPELTEADVEERIESMKAAQDAIKDAVIKELQEGSSILEGINGGSKKKGKGGFGKKLAQSGTETDADAVEAQKHYFGDN